MLKRRWVAFFGEGKANLALRIVVMFAGLICIALGIALAKLAAIGTAPISSLAAVMTETSERYGIPMTMGQWTFVFNMAFFLLEVVLLRSKFKPVQLLQIPLFFVMSAFVDVWIALFAPVAPMTYVGQLAFLLASVIVLGLGIRVQLASDLLMTPGDAAVQVISYVSGKRFSSCKVAWDVTLMCLAALTSLMLLGGLFQVREGTIIAALLVGPAVRFFDKGINRISWVIPESKQQLIAPLCPEREEVGEIEEPPLFTGEELVS